ncbi:MAG: META domain-containing protein, partial [Planctomycetales bacterium]|nr:META domain-containing protein [Planctomycetales bacterium]
NKTYRWRAYACDMADVNQAAGREWTLIQLNGQEVDAAKPPTLRFAHGKLTAFGGVNRLTATYALVDDTVIMSDSATTLMAGGPEAMKLEIDYAKTLASVNGFQVSGGELRLLSDGKVVATFRVAE